MFTRNSYTSESKKKLYDRIMIKYGNNFPNREIYRHACGITKINRKGKKQKRTILLTDKSIYNINGSAFKRRIDTKSILKISTSTTSREFVIHVDQDYDYHFSLKEPDKSSLIDLIQSSFSEISSTDLQVDKYPDEDLKHLVLTKPELKRQAAKKSIYISSQENSPSSQIKQVKIKHSKSKTRNSSTDSLDDSQSESLTVKVFKTVKKLTTDDFDFIRVLGRGNYGKVMLVRHKETSNLYAMKILRKEEIHKKNQVEHTRSERNILEAMKHPFLPRLRYAFQTNSKLYLVMSYYAGGELFHHLQHKGKFSEQEVKEISAMVLLAVEHLHKFEIIYRDIKPENILLDKDGFVGLADFGLAKCIGDEGRTFTFCGTAAYMSPEQLDGEAIGKTTDWWAFGILVYELLTGCAPFYDEDTHKMFRKIKNMPLSFPAWASPEVKSLIKGLLNRDIERRLGSGIDGAEEIKNTEFFKGVNFNKIANKDFLPSYIPMQLSSEEDTVNFDTMFTEEAVVDSFVPDKMDGKSMPFDNFSYCPEENEDAEAVEEDSDDLEIS